ncbi:DNA recombination and repair protein RecO [Gracilibacillus boraciitolerans JCM 21714]|uniref:DNA recombination and repair protein RecO n=1 Tax=Gracilibacillus boraciitolerans JCM 21714 TaxID=1298598 RepID=W4VEI5_9BACI|nr:DNA recombination and repair protein RecO [Gracilibacillus boraciitolerans JCM 21714]
MFEKVEGFILRSQDYGETHKIVTMLTPTMGKIGAIARGAKKTKSRMAAITQPFIHGSFLIQPGNSLATIQQGEVLTSFRKIERIFLKQLTQVI